MADESIKLSYNSILRRVRMEFDAVRCHDESFSYQEVFEKGRSKLEKEAAAGHIDFYYLFEDKVHAAIKNTKESFTLEELAGQKWQLTVGVGGKNLMGLVVQAAADEKSAYTLSFNAPPAVIRSWTWEGLLAGITDQCHKLQLRDEGNIAQVRTAYLRGVRGEKIRDLPILLRSEIENAENKPYKVVANRSRHELMLAVFDYRAFRDPQFIAKIVKLAESTAAKLSETDGVKFVCKKDELTEALTQAVQGFEGAGVDMPFVTLMASGVAEDEKAVKKEPASLTVAKKATPKPADAGARAQAGAAATKPQPKVVAESDSKTPQDYAGKGMLTLEISEDKMAADVASADPRLADVPDFVADRNYIVWEAARFGVVFGFDESSIAKIILALKAKQDISGLPLARGRTGSPPNGGFLYKLYKDAKIADASDEVVDIRRSQNQDLVKAGQVIAEVRYKTAGKSAINVCGEEVTPPAETPFEAAIGEGVSQGDDGRYYAEIDGMPNIDDVNISVSPSYVHKGDVNLKTGDIFFDGNVVIEGAIDSGATVVVSGELVVKGSIGGAFVSAKGSIECMQGITTTNQGRIRAGKDVRAGFVSNSNIYCGGSLIVRKSILNSNIAAGGAIECGQQGVLAGGSYTCRDLIKVGKLGLPQGSPTLCKVGVDAASDFKLTITLKRIEKLSQVEADDRLALRELVKKNKAQTTVKHEEKKNFYQDRLTRLRVIIERLRTREQKLTSSMLWNKEAIIYVYDSLYPNVDLTVAGTKIPVKHEVKEVTVSAQRSGGSFIKAMENQDGKPKDEAS